MPNFSENDLDVARELGSIKAILERIETQTIKTNGRVYVLEENQAKVKWVATGMSMIIGIIGTGIVFVLNLFKQ